MKTFERVLARAVIRFATLRLKKDGADELRGIFSLVLGTCPEEVVPWVKSCRDFALATVSQEEFHWDGWRVRKGRRLTREERTPEPLREFRRMLRRDPAWWDEIACAWVEHHNYPPELTRAMAKCWGVL